MTAADVADVLTSVLMIAGSLLTLSGCIGLVRFPDVLSRMHAATKPIVLGLVLMGMALGLQEPTFGTLTTLVLIAVFQMMTAPVSAHMVGRAAYRSTRVRKDLLRRDELADAVRRAGQNQDDA